MAKRKNILLLVHSFADPGGTQKYVFELGKLLAERHNIFECSFDAYHESHVFASDNRVLTLGVAAPRGIVDRLVGYALKAVRLHEAKRQYKIDITISNLWPADFINVLSMGPGKKISNGLVNVVGNDQNRPMLKYRVVVGWIYRRFDKIVAINEDLMDELGYLYRLSPAKLSCIHAFVTLPSASPQVPAHHGPRRRIAWFGRLHRMKNLMPLFAILQGLKKCVPSVQLFVIGEGPHRREFIAGAREAGLSVSEQSGESDADVVFLGFVSDPYRYLSECDLFVLTSKSEGFGLVLVEAMSAGLPVVASDCPTGGPHLIMGGKGRYQRGRKLVEQTPYGYLMPVPESGNALTNEMWERCITELLTNENKRAEISARCAHRATHFSTDRVKEQWFELIDAT